MSEKNTTMSDEGKLLTPECVLNKLVWRSTLELSEGLENFTTWTLTGITAIAGLLISNLNSVSQVVAASGLRSGLILLVVAIIFGVVSKQIGMAVSNGLKTISKLEAALFSPDGQNMLGSMTIEPKKFVEGLAEPFLWPLSRIVKSGGLKGMKDYLSSDKRLIKLMCIQLFTAWVHELSAVAALVAIALSMK